MSSTSLPPPFTHPSLPGLSYHDSFLPSHLHDSLLCSILAQTNSWKTLRNRTLQNWGGLPHIKGMIPQPLPAFLQPTLQHLHTHNIFQSPPNHVLINRYMPVQGIDPHVDGPAYKPFAAIISLKSPIVMDFYRRAEDGTVADYVASVLLRPRSLLLITASLYHDFFHAIAERQVDSLDKTVLNCHDDERGTIVQRKERISLTIRTSCRTIRNPLVRLSK